MDKPVIILGANGLGKAAMEAFESNDVVVYGFLDDKAEREGEELEQGGDRQRKRVVEELRRELQTARDPETKTRLLAELQRQLQQSNH